MNGCAALGSPASDCINNADTHNTNDANNNNCSSNNERNHTKNSKIIMMTIVIMVTLASRASCMQNKSSLASTVVSKNHSDLETGSTLGPDGDDGAEMSSEPALVGLLPEAPWGSNAWKSGRTRLQASMQLGWDTQTERDTHSASQAGDT